MGTDSPVSGTRPFTEAHAIAWVDFGFGFGRNLDRAGIGAVRRSLHSLLAHRGYGQSRRGRRGDVAAMYERRNHAGELVEAFHVHEEHLHIVLHEYRGWEQTKRRALDVLVPAIEIIQGLKIDVTKAGLVFRDIFINDDPTSYAASDVFKDSDYLPRRSMGSNPFWSATFIEDIENDDQRDEQSGSWTQIFSKIVADARIRGNESDGLRHVTTLTHSQMLFVDRDEPGKLFAWDFDALSSAFDVMHDMNAMIVLDVLSNEMSERIGLKEAVA